MEEQHVFCRKYCPIYEELATCCHTCKRKMVCEHKCQKEDYIDCNMADIIYGELEIDEGLRNYIAIRELEIDSEKPIEEHIKDTALGYSLIGVNPNVEKILEHFKKSKGILLDSKMVEYVLNEMEKE